jgi:hypothetical protein
MLYRLRQRLNYARFRHATSNIHRSPPIACDPTANCELHTMLSGRDASMYLVAIKSLLRFYSQVAVVIHSDGTLSEDWQSRIKAHVPGCRMIQYVEADRRALERLPAGSVLHQCRKYDASYRRLVDTELWSIAPSRIIMDADVLVLNEPIEVIDWIEGRQGTIPFLMGQAPRASLAAPATSKGVGRHVQTIFKEKVEALGRELGESACFLDGTTGGFYGCNGELSLEKIKRLLVAAEMLGIPMTEWGGEQCMVIYLLSVARAIRLDPSRYFNYFPDQIDKVVDAALIHFIGSDRFYRNIYSKRAAEVVRRLGNPLSGPRSAPDDPNTRQPVSSAVTPSAT